MHPVKVTDEGESHHLRERRSTGELRYRLLVDGVVEELLLQPNNGFLAGGARVRRSSGEAPPPNKDCHFKGTVAREPGSSVALSACHDGLVRETNYKYIYMRGMGICY